MTKSREQNKTSHRRAKWVKPEIVDMDGSADHIEASTGGNIDGLLSPTS